MTAYERVRDELRRAPRTWLVTGAAGFIGSALMEALLDLGQVAVGLDDFSTGSRANLAEVLNARPRDRGAFAFVEGDVCDPEVVRRACGGVDCVLHQAAVASVPRSLEDPVGTARVNVLGTLRVMEAAARAGARRVVYASSSAVYGACDALPLSEDAACAPLSPYAATKQANEEFAAVLARTHGLCSVGLRYFNVFGPRQDPEGAYASVVPRWIGEMLRGRPCRVNGDGSATRDFVPVDDVVQANLLAATAPLEGARTYNVGSGRRVSLTELHALIRDAVLRRRGLPAPAPEHGAARAGDVRHSHADIRRIRRELGFAPGAGLEAGLDRTVAWFERRCAEAPARQMSA